METFIKEVRYAIRSLAKRPGFVITALITLALGIGANTAIFSVVNAVLLRPLAYRNPEQLVTVLHDGSSPVAPANFLDWKQQSQSFESLAAAQWWEPNLSGTDQPEHLRGLQMTDPMFRLLGVDPIIGRTFTDGEDQPGREHVAVLSNRLWHRRFGANPNVIGQQITLDGESFTVIGVMPPEFQFAPFWATNAEIWSPLNLAARRNDRGGQSLRIFGRLKPTVSSAQAQIEMDTINRRLEQQYPDHNKGLTVSVVPLLEQTVGKTRPALLMLLAAVGFVLLIACANVANLMMARATARKKEIALKAVLGATRGRIASQLLTESLLLALSGGALGLLLAIVGVKALVRLGPATLPRLQTIGLDSSVLGFTFVVSVVTGILFGLAPILQIRKANFSESLNESARGSTSGKHHYRVRRLLVVAEMSLAVMLLIGGGLMVRSFLRLRAIDPGFDSGHLLTMTIPLAGSKHSDGPARAAFFDQILPAIKALPGVESASAINHLPIGGDQWTLGFTIEGQSAPSPGQGPAAVYRIVRPDYFRTMGETLLKGRDFNADDKQAAPGVVIVNEALARRYWPNDDPLGKRLKVNADDSGWREIVGIVKDAKQRDWISAAKPELYLPHQQSLAPRSLTLVVRTSPEPTVMTRAIQNEIWAVDKGLPVFEIRSMDDVISEALGPQLFNTLLLGIFGWIALTLATVGIYGVINNMVVSRTHEIGIRMALGARATDVLRMIVGQGMTLTAIGIAIGIAGSLFISQLLAGLLYGVSTTDAATFLSIPLLLAAVALMACYLPARRATRVDPMVALRND